MAVLRQFLGPSHFSPLPRIPRGGVGTAFNNQFFILSPCSVMDPYAYMDPNAHIYLGAGLNIRGLDTNCQGAGRD